MKSKVTRVLLAVMLVFMPVINGRSQQVSLTPEEQIKQYRQDISALAARTPPPEAQEEHRATLWKLRWELYTLLQQKIGALKKDIQDLRSSTSSAPSADYVRQLERILGDVENEAGALNQELTRNQIMASLPAASVTSQPISSPTPTATPAPASPTDAQIAVKSAVSNFSAESLRKAAAPAEVGESELPESACSDIGLPTVASPSQYDRSICRLAANVNGARTRHEILFSRDEANLFSILIAKLLKTRGGESYAAFITEAQEARVDQQIGAGPSIAGSTSLVSKGGVPYLLGFAVENGAAEQTQKDTTVTFRVNPAGAIKLFEKKGFITGFQETENDALMKFLRKTSVGLSFDTSRGNNPGVFTGNRQQLSAISAQVEFINERDPRDKKYEKEWEEFVANEGVALARRLWASTIETFNFNDNKPGTFKDPALQAWLDQTNQLIAAIDPGIVGVDRINEIAKVVRRQADLLPVNLVSDETVASITSFAKQFQAYSEKKQQILDKIAKGKILSLDYTNKREVNASDTSSFNFIAATGTQSKVDLTANGSFTFFHKRPLPASPTSQRPGRFRDFQFAGQLLVPLKVGDGQFEFWFSGRYERLLTDASTVAGTTMPNTKGDIAVGQFGLNIPIKSLGVKFPVSVTFANRTELVKEKEIRGNFGFTFNWDSLFSKLKPF
jgi:hypothetical protein